MHLRSCVRTCLVLAVGLTLAGCSDSSTESSPTSSTSTSPGPTTQGTTDSGTSRVTILDTGKSDLELRPGTYRSPEGFEPPVQVSVAGAGWRSTHRGPDGFDLSRPDPTKDAPLVALVIVPPPEADAAAALRGLKERASSAGSTIRLSTMTLAGADASVVDVRDGTGPLVMSALNGIGLDAGKGQRLRVVVTEIDGSPVVAAIFVPDQSRWQDGLQAALPLLSSISPA